MEIAIDSHKHHTQSYTFADLALAYNIFSEKNITEQFDNELDIHILCIHFISKKRTFAPLFQNLILNGTGNQKYRYHRPR